MEKIYMIKYTLTRVPKNKLQKNIDKLLRVDDRFLLKESDFDKYKKSVDESRKPTKQIAGVNPKIIPLK